MKNKNQNPSPRLEEEKRQVLASFLSQVNREEEEEETRRLASKGGFAYVNLVGYPISSEAMEIIPPELVKKYGLIGYEKSGKKVKVALTDPQNPTLRSVLSDLALKTGFSFYPVLASHSSIRYGQENYRLATSGRKPKEIILEEKIRYQEKIKNLTSLREKILSRPTTEAVDLILGGAISLRASDIHLQPEEKDLRLRYRIDGLLHDIAFLPKEATKAICSRLKFLAKLKLDVKRKPQDGKFFVRLDSRRIDIRVSSLPSSHGESLVLRLFDKEAEGLFLEELGLGNEDYVKVSEILKKPTGLILVCGPTGSGKTTTLYALLDKLNKPGVNIITLEDPIEYNLPGIVQSQVDEEVSYDFKVGLRSIVRQDPDVIMVGEIRDFETAEMATHAALTGHLVLSTLHTNDSFGAIPRLIDLKVEPFLLTSALNLIIAQRLVRRICPHCQEEYTPSPEIEKEIREVLDQKPLQSIKLKKGKGCDFCHQTGFLGRIGIFEILKTTSALEKLIFKKAPASEIKKIAKKQGMETMEQDGLKKALSGITTPEEVWRVAKI